ncbi:MAG: DnaJ domain-containing protein [Acidobacteria bacterium]|nr:DnaJ domain-containing protein [Acidobacteriota bacterium]
MNGQLRDHPLVELIHEITGARLSGALRLAHERSKGAVYFDGGEIVAALLNLRAHRLAELLRRESSVGAERLDQLAGEGVSDDQLGAALVAAGALSSAELDRLRGQQSSEGLRELLKWSEGEWAFNPRVRLSGNWRARLDTPQLLLEGVRELPTEFVSGRMADDEELFSPVAGADGGEAAGGLQLLPLEAFILTRASAPMSLSELIAVSGLPEAETRRALYALALGGLLRRERWPPAFSPEMLAGARRASSSPKSESKEETLKPPPTPTHAPPSAPPPVEEAAQEEAVRRSPREEMEELLERARAETHYAVLGVTRAAPTQEVKRVYYALARRFHPDHFRRDSDEKLQQQLGIAFARVAQAYEVLKDSSLRAAYDLKLAASAASRQTEASGDAKTEDAGAQKTAAADPTSPAVSQESALLYRAEERFQQGVAALQQNNTELATRLLGEAALLVPKQARYRALYGRALSREKNSRRQAESELLAAIGLDDQNPAYRVMLAELYIEIGLRRRAKGELERALSHDPAHATALRLLSELSAAK